MRIRNARRACCGLGLPGEKTPFAGVVKSLPKPRSAPWLSLGQAGSVSALVSNSLNLACDIKIHEDSQRLIESERRCVLKFFE